MCSTSIWKIDPCNCIDYQRDEHNLHAFLLFCMLTAGKSADWIAELDGLGSTWAERNLNLWKQITRP